MKHKLLIYCITFLFAVIWFSIFWVKNCDKYTQVKGDEFFNFVEILIFSTYIFNIFLRATALKLNILFILIMPLVTCVAAFLFGFILMTISAALTNINHTDMHTILISGILYGLLTVTEIFGYDKVFFRKI